MYKKEELKFLNMNIINKIFEIEVELSLEEKIKFINEIEDGKATYLLNLFTKWLKDKETLPKGKYNKINTSSKKAWIRRNDKLKIIDIEYDYGSYYFLGSKYPDMDLKCPTTDWGYNKQYTGSHIVHQWFHDLCIKLKNEENKYFKTIDPIEIKLKELKELAKGYNLSFGNKCLNDILWNNKLKEELTEEKLDKFIETYNKLDKFVDKLSKELEEDLKEED